MLTPPPIAVSTGQRHRSQPPIRSPGVKEKQNLPNEPKDLIK